MSTQIARISIAAAVLCAGLAIARPATADVCITIDEQHDTLSPSQRVAALLLLARQFELAGERVVAQGCPTSYVVSHVQLGERIAITLSGPGGQRDAIALGLDDVPRVYSQMVRSLLSGRSMNAHGVLDRTNVSEAQAEQPRRVASDSIVYARLGYGGIFGDRTYGGPSIGLIGFRKELDSFGVDVSFLNFQYKSDSGYGYSGGMTGSWLKLEALRFMTPESDRSAYFGGGLSWSTTNLETTDKSWSGSGLQGELTAGYELGRASTIRVFVQADAGLPFYNVTSRTFAYWTPYAYTAPATEHRYAPSLMLSIGVGWQRGRK